MTTSYTNYQIATAQESTPAPHERGVFYGATRYHIALPLNATLIISSEKDAKGKTRVDDVVTITMALQSGASVPPVSYTHDYSRNCSGDVYFMDPLDLISTNSAFSSFLGQTVKVTIEFSDKCGGYMHGTNFYLCVGTS